VESSQQGSFECDTGNTDLFTRKRYLLYDIHEEAAVHIIVGKNVEKKSSLGNLGCNTLSYKDIAFQNANM
jgi:hypothetical protein